jgi:hypothetical protein
LDDGGDVSKYLTAAFTVIVTLGVSALPALAAPDPQLSKELLAVIASQEFTCGKIVKIDTQADRDYLVECQNGNSYEINADAAGKLAAHPLGHKFH